jgi:hypothetical protein
MDSTGLRALLAARNRPETNDRQLPLIEAIAPARRMFELTGLAGFRADRPVFNSGTDVAAPNLTPVKG